MGRNSFGSNDTRNSIIERISGLVESVGVLATVRMLGIDPRGRRCTMGGNGAEGGVGGGDRGCNYRPLSAVTSPATL